MWRGLTRLMVAGSRDRRGPADDPKILEFRITNRSGAVAVYLGSALERWRSRSPTAQGVLFPRLAQALPLLEVLAAGDGDTVVEMLSEGRDGEEQMQLLAAVARRGRHRGLVLLQMVVSSHPDRVVGNFARKEAFRLRSKLASTSND